MGGEACELGDPFGFVAGCQGAGLGHGDGGLVGIRVAGEQFRGGGVQHGQSGVRVCIDVGVGLQGEWCVREPCRRMSAGGRGGDVTNVAWSCMRASARAPYRCWTMRV